MAGLSSAGTTVHVSASLPATYDAAGYNALSWTQVTDVSDIPEFGPSTSVNTFNPIDSRVTQKSTGSIDYGSVALGFAHVVGDAGQGILSTALGNNTGISVKVTRPDTKKDYFTGIVSSFTRNHSGVDSFFIGTAKIEINKPIVTV